MGDPTRAAILVTLMDGRAFTATELARAANVTPQTASTHLARLTEAGFLAVARQGRHRYHRLASPAVAGMIEGVMAVAAGRNGATDADSPRLVVGPRDKALRHARMCYEHLAGRIAVAMADRMVERGQIEFSADGGALTREGERFLRGLGVDLEAAKRRAAHRRGPFFCRPCLDWSERRAHIGGAIGAALCQTCLARGWMRRSEGTRAVALTSAGQRALGKVFGSGVLT